VAVAAATLPASKAWAFPVASSSYEPARPLTQEPVRFTSTATTDPGVTIPTQAWDLDDDGEFDDASGPIATFTFVRPGPQRVGLRVVDSGGREDTYFQRVVIGNRAPEVSFLPVSGQPSPGAATTFLSTSSDPDGFIVSHVWDLDQDGEFDDATGSQATLTFPAYGVYRIGLRVWDDSGASSTLVSAITGTSGNLMTPFPIVRVSGIVRKGGMKLRLLSVRAPVGASVRVRCSGPGCPFRLRTRTVASHARSSASIAPPTGLVRIRRFGRRLLRVGAAVRVYVTRGNAIGKYTLLRVRSGRLPARIDRCVLPGSRTPVFCPP
jgi:hypothetical protein